MEILLPLLAAHLLGDFALQPKSWVKQKQADTGRYKALSKHVMVHFVLSVLFVFRFSFLPFALALAIMHFAIDELKLRSKSHPNFWFYFDQLLHFLSILFICSLYAQARPDYLSTWPIINYSSTQIWTIVTGYLLIGKPTSVIISRFISKWSPKKTIVKENSPQEIDQKMGLDDAGHWIGIMERVLTYTFVISGNMAAVGFLVGAKSIFRVGDMKEPWQRGFTEYVLIGTLLSFGTAVLVGKAVELIIHSIT